MTTPLLSYQYSYKTNMSRLEEFNSLLTSIISKLPQDLKDNYHKAYTNFIGYLYQVSSTSRLLSDKKNEKMFITPILNVKGTVLQYLQSLNTTLFSCYDLDITPRRFYSLKEIVLDLHSQEGYECYNPDQINIAINNHLYKYALYTLAYELLNLFVYKQPNESNEITYFHKVGFELLDLKLKSINNMNSLVMFSTNKFNIERVKLVNLRDNFLYVTKGKSFSHIHHCTSMSYKDHLNHEDADGYTNAKHDSWIKAQFEALRPMLDDDKYRDASISDKY